MKAISMPFSREPTRRKDGKWHDGDSSRAKAEISARDGANACATTKTDLDGVEDGCVLGGERVGRAGWVEGEGKKASSTFTATSKIKTQPAISGSFPFSFFFRDCDPHIPSSYTSDTMKRAFFLAFSLIHIQASSVSAAGRFSLSSSSLLLSIPLI